MFPILWRDLAVRLSAVFLLVVCLMPRSVAAQEASRVIFGNGAVEVVLRTSYRLEFKADGALVAKMNLVDTIWLELTLHQYPALSVTPNIGERSVQAIADGSGRRINRACGKIVLFEPVGDRRIDEATYRVPRWYIGFGETLVVMTLTALVQDEMSPPMRDFVERRYDEVLKSLRRISD